MKYFIITVLLIIFSIYATPINAKMKSEISITILQKKNNSTTIPYSSNKNIDSDKTAPQAIPDGMLMFYNRPLCPPGWNKVSCADGRYLVGFTPNGTIGGAVGTQLSDQENRPTGQHTHLISDPGHIHYRGKRIPNMQWYAHNPLTKYNSITLESYQTSVNVTGITINNAGSVPGTNAPYAQLLLCKYAGTANMVSPDQLADVPPGAVMYFNSANCPNGWGPQSILRGRYAVGLTSGGSLSSTIGIALEDQENRAVGQHNHTINDPGHCHYDSRTYCFSGYNYYGGIFDGSYQAPCTNSFTGITIQDSGSIDGTNAPYVQLLACQPVLSAPGKVLNNLTISKSGNDIILNWQAVGGACIVTSYGVYRGTLPFTIYNHASLDCAVLTNTYADTLANESYYYLVVPNNSTDEGSYGTDSSVTERPQSSSPCKTQNLTPCN